MPHGGCNRARAVNKNISTSCCINFVSWKGSPCASRIPKRCCEVRQTKHCIVDGKSLLHTQLPASRQLLKATGPKLEGEVATNWALLNRSARIFPRSPQSAPGQRLLRIFLQFSWSFEHHEGVSSPAAAAGQRQCPEGTACGACF